MSGIFDQVINYAPPSLLKGTVTYKGAWSAATNTPTLINPPDSTTNGFYYVVSAAGTQFSLSFNIGDWIISNGSAWQKVDNTDSVDSVFGRTGAVVGVSTDYSAVGITATAVGASSPSTGAFTTLSATTPLAATSGGTGLSSLGTGVATFLGTPTSANLAAAVTNETGSGSLVFGTSPTITTPVIAQINDANGNETLKLASIASAVNEVTIENAATGNAVHISATGGDASVGLHLVGKGASGYVNVQDSTDATKRIMFNAAGGTTNTRTMLSSTQTVDRTLSLPDATDTLVGRATTDTLTNKTLTSPTITGGALNGTLGATTPSTIAGTTGTFSGAVAINNASLKIGTNSGYTYFVNDQMNFGFSENSAYTGVINYTGYNGGTTQFRNLDIYDGKSTRIAQFTSTGLNSTAIGATTPSTVAATTGTFSGAITSTLASGNYFNAASATTAPVYLRQTNTSGQTTLGTEGSTAAQLLTGSTAYGSVLGYQVGKTLSIGSSATVLQVNDAGLAITGTLSCTTGANFATSSGNLCIGTTSSSNTNSNSIYALPALGAFVGQHDSSTASGTAYYAFNYNSTQIGSITQTGTTAVLYNTTSDYRRKSNIQDLVNSGTFIDALKPRTFDWETGDKAVGFIAHEFAEVSPSSVSGEKDAVDADGKPVYQSMQASSSEVIANLVAELQSLRKRLAALEAK